MDRSFKKKIRSEKDYRQPSDLLPGLPDGPFSNQKSRFWYILEGLALEVVGLLYGHLDYLTAIGYFVYFVTSWYILW
jgi:hypothetical protein